MHKIRSVFKIHGGKGLLHPWILQHFPNDYQKYDYVEPYAGAANVMMNKEPSSGIEAINDLDKGVVRIFQALRDEPKHFISCLKKKKYSENTFTRALNRQFDAESDYVEHAVNEFILRRMSRGGMKKEFSWSERKRGNQPGDLNAWKTCLEQLPETAKRLKNLFIFNHSAIHVIKAFDHPNTLLYVDPPYLQSTRTAKKVYEHEMSFDDHDELIQALLSFKGKVIISGYNSALYNRALCEWKCIKKKVPNHSSQQSHKSPRTEILWLNFR